jgi:hypothetical protein
MWVLIVISLITQTVITVPGFSTEQTCSAGAEETIAALTHVKHGRWTYHCIKTS